jgi:hypothetical protein
VVLNTGSEHPVGRLVHDGPLIRAESAHQTSPKPTSARVYGSPSWPIHSESPRSRKRCREKCSQPFLLWPDEPGSRAHLEKKLTNLTVVASKCRSQLPHRA